MSSQPAAQRVIRFGLFEFDLAGSELRKQGRKIKLQDQPFHVLAMLLRRPGEVITREELQRELWPVDTFVEFDQGLNTAIKKIRQALGDSADNPRFVATIPRRAIGSSHRYLRRPNLWRSVKRRLSVAARFRSLCSSPF